MDGVATEEGDFVEVIIFNVCTNAASSCVYAEFRAAVKASAEEFGRSGVDVDVGAAAKVELLPPAEVSGKPISVPVLSRVSMIVFMGNPEVH